MPQDVIQYEVLEDGRIKWTTDRISPANHTNADRFLAEIGRLLGGTTEVKRKSESHTHHVHENAKVSA